jgi:RNA-binding protein 48
MSKFPYLLVDCSPIEQFTDVYHIEFKKLEHARRAKKFLDAKNFYGGLLHISYAPEYESINDLREKLKKRKTEVLFRLKLNSRKSTPTSNPGKRKLNEAGEGSSTHKKCK